MKSIIQSVSHFQGEIGHNLSLYKEKFTHLEFDINLALTKLNFCKHLTACGAIKQKGRPLSAIFFAMILLPFFKKSFSHLWEQPCLPQLQGSGKDAFYDALKIQTLNWRSLIFRLAKRFIKLGDDVPIKDKLLIADDTANHKRGKKIELVSYVRDHTQKRSVLGFKHLVLSYFDGKSFLPLDFSIHASGKRPSGSYSKPLDGRSVSGKRRREALRKKTDVLLQMLQRAQKQGIDAAYLLFDSWFAHPKIIIAAYKTGYNVICQLARNKTKYYYRGQAYTLKQLYRGFVKDSLQTITSLGVKAAALRVQLANNQEVTLVFSKSKKAKKWVVFLSTDTTLSAREIIETYAKRWSIELFFKDCKQLLHFGKEQNRDFDAIIAHHSLVFIRYIVISYILRQKGIYSVCKTLFEQMADEIVQRTFAQRILDYFKLLLSLSIELLSIKIPQDMTSQLLELIDTLMINILPIRPIIISET
jgi:hypothetical protein